MYSKSNGENFETDIVVIGTGPGGLTSVASAVASGVEVVALEANERIGGNSLLCTGWVAFVDSKLQREQGIKVSTPIARPQPED